MDKDAKETYIYHIEVSSNDTPDQVMNNVWRVFEAFTNVNTVGVFYQGSPTYYKRPSEEDKDA